MTSALPFSGGIYGFFWTTSGPFAGYLVVCFELLMNVSYIISGFSGFQNFLFRSNQQQRSWSYLSLLSDCFYPLSDRRKAFLEFYLRLCYSALVLLIIYCFGLLHDLDLTAYAQLSQPATAYNFITYLKMSGTQYMGIQYVAQCLSSWLACLWSV